MKESQGSEGLSAGIRETYHCYGCGALLAAEVAICLRCGRNQFTVCARCGEMTRKGRGTCRACGTRLRRTEHRRHHRRGAVVIALAIVLGAAIIGSVVGDVFAFFQATTVTETAGAGPARGEADSPTHVQALIVFALEAIGTLRSAAKELALQATDRPFPLAGALIGLAVVAWLYVQRRI
ncbi:MAG: hypothetical protein HYY04_14900 [Chloroflexi bacterium]|nr:hypothetical protein [Chloroflexota bacterium]